MMYGRMLNDSVVAACGTDVVGMHVGSEKGFFATLTCEICQWFVKTDISFAVVAMPAFPSVIVVVGVASFTCPMSWWCLCGWG